MSSSEEYIKGNHSKTSSNYTNADYTSSIKFTKKSESSEDYDESCNDPVFSYNNECITLNVSYETPLILGTNKFKNVSGIEKVNGKVLLGVEGDMYVSGRIFTGNQSSQHINSSSNINMQSNLDVVKNNNTTYYYVSPNDISNILYVSPLNGPIYIVLGKEGDVKFKNNQTLTIKDTSLLYNEGASYNIFVTVPNNHIAIEHYGADCKLKVSSPGTYVINTSNGAVTFRFMVKSGNCTKSCWLIENQFIGNPRLLPTTGLTFAPIK